jgi:hypothetical protein
VSLTELLARWRADAQVLRRHGAQLQSDVLLRCAEEIEQVREGEQLETLSIKVAAAETGFSQSQLRRLFPGQRRIARGALPRKARAGESDVAGHILPESA